MNSALPTDHEVVLAVLAILATTVATLVWVIRSGKYVRSTDDAVNGIGPGQHRLYDKVDAICESVEKLNAWHEEMQEQGWSHLPPDLHDSVGITLTIRELQRQAVTNKQDHEMLRNRLDEIVRTLDTLVYQQRHDHGSD